MTIFLFSNVLLLSTSTRNTQITKMHVNFFFKYVLQWQWQHMHTWLWPRTPELVTFFQSGTHIQLELCAVWCYVQIRCGQFEVCPAWYYVHCRCSLSQQGEQDKWRLPTWSTFMSFLFHLFLVLCMYAHLDTTALTTLLVTGSCRQFQHNSLFTFIHITSSIKSHLRTKVIVRC